MDANPFIFFVHYHLNGGGVTKIIEQQSKALSELNIPHLVLCGENTSCSKIPHQIIEGLNYCNKDTHTQRNSDSSLTNILETILKIVASLRTQDIIFHFHNHAIGLNWNYENLVSTLAEKFRLVLQLHDFIEDGRKQNLKNITSFDKLYPKAEHIQYCTINSRDKNILEKAGAAVTLLPNSISSPARCSQPIEKLIFYPVQALRRKNLGELLLLALACPSDYSIRVANTPKESLKLVQFWQKISKSLSLPIEFGGENLDTKIFEQYYEKASHIVTTSIQEGFGMVFIDPVHFQKPLFGRDLPEITIDLKQAGLKHADLYLSIEVNFPEPHQMSLKDFGNADEATQVKVLTILKNHPELLDQIIIRKKDEPYKIKEYISNILSRSLPTPHDSLLPWQIEALKKNMIAVYNPLLNQTISNVSQLNHQHIYKHFSQEKPHKLKGLATQLI